MKTKKKNQNKIIKIAAALMILCLITTCAISATFAKYATTDSTEDTARVAKWGVVLSASGTLFGKNYAANTATSNSDAIIAASSSHSASTHSVVSNDDKVVAPGTKNDVGVQLKLTGTPEVAYKVFAETNSEKNNDVVLKNGTYGVMVDVSHGLNDATVLTEYYVYNKTNQKYVSVASDATYNKDEKYYKLVDKVVVNETKKDGYYPIVWNLNDGITDKEYYKTSDMASDIITAVKKEYRANDPLSSIYTITWKWAINGNDGADTILGNINNTGDNGTVVQLSGSDYIEIQQNSYNLEVGFNITISAAQID